MLTLGLIGTWQVFDQVLVATQGGPGNTTVTPAYLSYTSSFMRQDWGQGAAIAFILFGIIVVMTLVQRAVLRERDVPRRRRRRRLPDAPLTADGVTGQPVPQQVVDATTRTENRR